MKNFFRILTLTITILMIAVPVFASNTIKVQLNGEYVDFTDANGKKVEPQIINDRTMVPMRKIFEVLGADVEWIPETRSIKSNSDGLEIGLQINNKIAAVKDTNGVTKEIQLDSAPTIVNDRTLVPVRFIAESLNKKVDWDGQNRIVIIKDKKDEGMNEAHPISKIYSNAKISVNMTNVYSESNENSEIIGKFEKNTIVVAQQYENGWSRVTKDNITGWIKTENINFPSAIVEAQKEVLNSKIELYEGKMNGIDVKTLIRSINTYNANDLFPSKLLLKDNTNSNVKLVNNSYIFDGINNSSDYIIELIYDEEGYVKEIIINKEKNDVVNYKISDGYNIDLNKWKRVENSLITENMTKEINSDGKNIKLKFEINRFPSELKIYVNNKKYTYDENEYANYSIAFVDLDESDNYKEIEIAIQDGIFTEFEVYRIKQNGLELISNSALLYNKETKQYISGLKNVIDSVNPSPVLGYYLYENGEFKYIDKFPNGEEIVDKKGNLNSNFQKEIFNVRVEVAGFTAENLYEQIGIENFSDRALMEKVALVYAKIRFKKMYEEKNERGFIETKYDIEIIENHDARYYDENRMEKHIIIPAGTILKGITSWSHAGGTYDDLMYRTK